MNTKIFQDLLTKKMTRREFLFHVAAAAVAVMGFSAFIKNLTNVKPEKSKVESSFGYGGGPYGGASKKV